MTHRWQDRPVESIPGVGPKVLEKLTRLHITTAEDLINHFPRRYDDFSAIMPIRNMRPGKVTFKGEVERVASRYARTRKLNITEAIISDGTGTIKAVWFNQSYLAKTIPIGTPVLISGELKFKNNDLAMQSPAIERIEADHDPKDTARIVPIYPETDGLSSKQLRAIIKPLLPLISTTEESLPQSVVESAGVIPYAAALTQIHFPDNQANLKAARERLAFDELWHLMLASLVTKYEINTEVAPIIEFELETAKTFTSVIGFELTPHQKQAAWEIIQDMGRALPMNRLLEGDVGSGKTVVATMAAVMALHAGYQVALMVPTEILARQHAAKVEPLLKSLGYDCTLILGKQSAAQRKVLAERLAKKEPILAIGTQALLSDNVELNRLGLVIIDEQHRFGVGQRQLLKSKSGYLPHLLSMTATPIPRTLQLTVYGDLDISIIAGLPPGRQPIKTAVLEGAKRQDAYDFINSQLEQGRQGFVVCPLIDDSEMLEAKSVTQEIERLSSGPFKHRKLGLLHGKQPAADKQAVMDDFAAGKLDLLVATSVIEVGIDVPNATIMLIDGADRFGLAALHQLRGRVGRGQFASYCFLVSDSKTTSTLDRLKALEKSRDGFRLAQIDLELRGPGQIYGRRQHGTLDVQFADMSDAQELAKVRTEAEKFLANPENMVKYPQIAAKVNALRAVTSLD